MRFSQIFDSKEQLDLFLQGKIGESIKTDIISTYNKKFQGYYEAAIDGKGAHYIVNYALTKQANRF